MAPDDLDRITRDEYQFRKHMIETTTRVETKVDALVKNEGEQFDRINVLETNQAATDARCAERHAPSQGSSRKSFFSLAGIFLKGLIT
jgi:hypothetical protein